MADDDDELTTAKNALRGPRREVRMARLVAAVQRDAEEELARRLASPGTLLPCVSAVRAAQLPPGVTVTARTASFTAGTCADEDRGTFVVGLVGWRGRRRGARRWTKSPCGTLLLVDAGYSNGESTGCVSESSCLFGARCYMYAWTECTALPLRTVSHGARRASTLGLTSQRVPWPTTRS